MKKRILAGVLASAAALTAVSFSGCEKAETTSDDGKKLRIACWNYEVAEWFDAYYADKIPDDVTVEWVQFPNEGSNYQDNLDRLLKANVEASADDKIDLFLSEADYIRKYVNSDYSLEVKDVDTSNAYKYTLDAGTDSSGKLKAISPQATPSGVIIRKSIANEVLGTTDPDAIQSKIDTWEKFDAVAADAKAKGYMMTPSAIETYRAFANNATQCYLTDKKFAPTDAFNTWYAQAKKYVENGYTQTCKMWDAQKTNQMFKDGKVMCFFGPMWYYAFSMGNAFNTKDNPNNTKGDWLFVQGPAAHYWGGTWILGANGTDNSSLVKQIQKDWLTDTDLMNKLSEGKGLKKRNEADGAITDEDKYNPCFVNNKTIVSALASDNTKGYEGFDGQNDWAVQAKIAESIKWDNNVHTMYDQTFNETLPECMLEALKGSATEEKAWENFYAELSKKDPTITH